MSSSASLTPAAKLDSTQDSTQDSTAVRANPNPYQAPASGLAVNNATINTMPKVTNTLAAKLNEKTLAKLTARKISKQDLAEQLGVTATHLSRTLTAINFKRIPAPDYARRKAAKLLYTARGDNRLTIAGKVANKTLDIETACKLAMCSERTMRRYLAKLP